MNARHVLLGQIGVVVLLALALWNPPLPGRRVPVHLVILLDDSASMTRAALDAAWQALAPRIAGLPVGSRVSVVRFGAEPAVELSPRPVADPAVQALLAHPTPPRTLPLDDRQTDVARAVRAGLTLDHAGLPPVLVVVSDGAATLGDTAAALSAAGSAGVAVRWWRPPGTNGAPDAWIARLQAPTRVGAGEPVVLTALLAADAVFSRPLMVRSGEHQLVRRAIDLAPGQPVPVTLPLDPLGSGMHEVQVELLGPDRSAENNRRSVLIECDGPVPVLILSPHPERSAVAASLRAGGWPTLAVPPDAFWPARLEGVGVLVLEEIAVADLADVDWAAVARAVRVDGMGLIVLGGPGTFAAGGYRHSTLEGLLPVLAEAPRHQRRAAVVFVVDSSGSMAQPTGDGAARLTLARHAVAASARSLAPADRAALIGFDAEARTLLPLASRPDQGAAMAAALGVQPGGGTRIAPALSRALTLLAPSEAPERLVVLATDGRFTDSEQVTRLADALASAHVDVVVIATGAEAGTAVLRGLTSHGRGRLVQAADALELPQLMSTEVQRWRNSLRRGPLIPHRVQPLPFSTDDAATWPAVDALQLTRPRTGAQVYLATAEGEPLLAAGFSGAGRAVALPAGLGPWAETWRHWPAWSAFLGGLVQWAAGATIDPKLDVRVVDAPTGLYVAVEATDARGEWAGPAPMPVRVRDPGGAWHARQAQAAGPGRWDLDVPAPAAGRYDIIAGPPGRERHLALMREPLQELLPADGEPNALERLVAQRRLSIWSPASAIPAPTLPGGARGWLATLALVLFVLILTVERLLPGTLIRWPSLGRTTPHAR
jgi:uncharacterized protein YegL